MKHRIIKTTTPTRVNMFCPCGWTRTVYRNAMTHKMMRKRVEEARREHEFKAAEEARGS